MTFTYSTPHIRKITDLFKCTNMKIAFKCNNTISQLTKARTHNNTTIYDKSGICKLTCNTCKLSYVGQISRNLKFWYQEHLRYMKNNNLQSAVALHVIVSRNRVVRSQVTTVDQAAWFTEGCWFRARVDT